MESRSIPSRIALWLVPAGPDLDLLQDLVRRLVREHGAVEFQPHATLLSGTWTGTEGELGAALETVARAVAPVSLEVERLGWTNAFTTYFFARLAPRDFGAAAEAALQAVRRAFPSAPLDWEPNRLVGPHISLMYSDRGDELDRERLAREVAADVPARVCFDRIEAWSPGVNGWTDVGSWQRCAGARLTGRGAP